MKLKVFTLRLDPSTGAFDDGPMVAFLAEREVLSVYEHFVVHEGQPLWSLLVSYADPPTPGGPRPKQTRAPPEATLTDEARPLYDALRRWRNDRARGSGRPAYVLFSNRQLTEIARSRPTTLAELSAIHGVGDGRVRDFGAQVLAVVQATPLGAEAPEPDDADG